MGVSREQGAENRRAIMAAAEKLFRERGVDAVGLAELMKAAGFTQGGFYNHFKSKDALVAAVMDKALAEGGETIAAVVDQARSAAADAPGADALEQHIRWYLSPSIARISMRVAPCPASRATRAGWTTNRAWPTRAGWRRISIRSRRCSRRVAKKTAARRRSCCSARGWGRWCCRTPLPMLRPRSPTKYSAKGASIFSTPPPRKTENTGGNTVGRARAQSDSAAPEQAYCWV